MRMRMRIIMRPRLRLRIGMRMVMVMVMMWRFLRLIVDRVDGAGAGALAGAAATTAGAGDHADAAVWALRCTASIAMFSAIRICLKVAIAATSNNVCYSLHCSVLNAEVSLQKSARKLVAVTICTDAKPLPSTRVSRHLHTNTSGAGV